MTLPRWLKRIGEALIRIVTADVPAEDAEARKERLEKRVNELADERRKADWRRDGKMRP